MTKNPLDPGGPFDDYFRRERDRAELFKKALGPAHELQQQMKMLDGPLAHVAELRKSGALAGFTELQKNGTVARFAELQKNGTLSSLYQQLDVHNERMRALQKLATPSWMQAIQQTAIGFNRDELGILKTQKLLAGAIDKDVLTLARTVDSYRSTFEKVMAATKWQDEFRSLVERLAPDMTALKIAAERARMLDMMSLRATADTVSTSAVMFAAEQVLEANRLIEAMGQAESPEQGVNLFAALLAVVAAMFARFGENTMNELRNVGGVKVIELLSVALGFYLFMSTPDMSPAEKKEIAALHAEVETLGDKLDQIRMADVAARKGYVSLLPRAEMKRAAPIRRAGDAKAQVLMKGTDGMLIAVKRTEGRWRLVVYHDPLTDQLSEGWVHTTAVRMLDAPVGKGSGGA